jgi:hypothetical protein
VIGCVDTRKARAAIAKCAEDWSEVDYWLDLGNSADSGQFVLGEPLNRRNRRHRLRLRTVSELFPEVIQGELDEDGLPSCSAVEALDRQAPFVNPVLANHALAMLARLFGYGTICFHGAFVGLSSLSDLQSMRVDPRYWQRLAQKSLSTPDFNAGCHLNHLFSNVYVVGVFIAIIVDSWFITIHNDIGCVCSDY